MGANRLQRIIKNSENYISNEPGFYDMIIEKLQELLCDEENFVKIEALETIIHSLKYISKEDFTERLEPIVKEIFEKDVREHEEVLYSMAPLCGKLMFELDKNEIKHNLSTNIIEFFESLVNNDNDELREKAAYSFTYFFTQFYTDEDELSVESNEEESKESRSSISNSKWEEYTK
jgi:hypothetical protein